MISKYEVMFLYLFVGCGPMIGGMFYWCNIMSGILFTVACLIPAAFILRGPK